MVPLLVIRIKVMMAINISGMGSPPKLRANTSLGFGQGTRVDMRTFMYEVRKHVKMNVSLKRKNHIMAFPQGTWNVCLSELQSWTKPWNPSGRVAAAAPDSVTSDAIGLNPSCREQ
jgi:hypothetical protein